MHREDVPIAEPCAEDWSAMSGGDRRRFCAQCTKHVHDLSEMTEPDARALLQQESAPCVRYRVDAEGSIVHRRSARVAALAAVLAAAAPAYADPEPPPQATLRPHQPVPEEHVMMGEVTVHRPMIMGRVAVRPEEPPPPVNPVQSLPVLPAPPPGQSVIPEVQAVIDAQRSGD